MSVNHGVELQVFVEVGCEMCDRALQLAASVDNAYPRLTVSIVDVRDDTGHEEDVFAVPTFMLNGRVLSLGNPQSSYLHGEIESLLRESGLV